MTSIPWPRITLNRSKQFIIIDVMNHGYELWTNVDSFGISFFYSIDPNISSLYRENTFFGLRQISPERHVSFFTYSILFLYILTILVRIFTIIHKLLMPQA
jgi:hypothetical protein